MLAKQHFQPTLEEYQKEFNQEFLKEIEFPDYVGYYFRDYYNILEIQLKQKESQIDVNSDNFKLKINFVSFIIPNKDKLNENKLNSSIMSNIVSK